MAKPKLFIATPCNRTLNYQYVDSFAATWRWLYERYDMGVGFAASPLVYVNRNELIQKAYDDDVDYMLFVDSDMDWRPEMIHKMAQFDKDIVTGVYLSRKPMSGNAHLPVLYERVDSEYRALSTFPDTPFHVDACGAGFLMLRKNVIRKMIDTYSYPFDPLKGSEAGLKTHGSSDYYGEDLSFSWRATEAGFEILCMPDVKIGHIVDFSLGKG